MSAPECAPLEFCPPCCGPRAGEPVVVVPPGRVRTAASVDATPTSWLARASWPARVSPVDGASPRDTSPRLEAPELEAPGLTVPELEAPGLTVPDVEVPELEAPGLDAPGLEAAEFGVPRLDAA